jgi:transcriptional regulator with XRE-family HTH domain
MKKRAALSVGETLRTLREERKMTQEELGNRAGVGQAMIGHVETGRRQLTLSTAVRIARALDVSVDELAAAEYTEADELQTA